MWLLDGYIDRRPLMERDGSGVSALVGLDGFVVRAQLLDDASGEWWLAVEVAPGFWASAGTPRIHVLSSNRSEPPKEGVLAVLVSPRAGRRHRAHRRGVRSAGGGWRWLAIGRRVERPDPFRRSPVWRSPGRRTPESGVVTSQ
jgi:hypothetical protein